MKKKTGIIITIAIILAILLVAGAFVVLYFLTDIFKSEQQLFWKYASNSNQLAKMISNENEISQKEWKESHSYTAKGDLNIAVTKETGTKEIKLGTTTKHNQNTGRTYADITLYNGEAEVLKGSYINSADIYALYCKDIYEPYYIGFRNGDLKQFAEKLGLQDTGIEIPDSISFDETNQMPQLTKEEEKYLSDTYSNLVINSIPKERYSKTEKENITINNQDYTTVGYKLDLSGEEFKQVIIDLLTKIKEDEQTMSIITRILSNIDKSTIQTIINKAVTTMQQGKGSVDKMSFIIYQPKKGVTRIKIKDNQKSEIAIDIDNGSDNKKNVDISFNISENENAEMTTAIQMKIEKQILSNMNFYTVTIMNNQNEYQITINTSLGNISNNTIENNSKITIIDKDTTIETTYYKTIQAATEEVDIQELTNSSAVIINNYPAEQLKTFFDGISSQIETVIPDKIGQLNIQITDPQDAIYYADGMVSSIFTIINANGASQSISVMGAAIITALNQVVLSINNEVANSIGNASSSLLEQEKQVFNQKFENYKGESVNGTIVKTLLSTIMTNNNAYENEERQVKVRISGNNIKKIDNWNEQGESDTAKISQLRNDIKAGNKYSVVIEYDTNGFVEIVNIMEKQS